MNKAHLERLVRRYDNRARVLVYRTAPQHEQRELFYKVLRELLAERDRLRDERRQLGRWEQRLLKAAEFVVDVDGDPPSIDLMRKAVNDGRRRREIDERLNDIDNERKNITRRTNHHRVEVHRISDLCGIRVSEILFTGDSYAEVAERVLAKSGGEGTFEA